MLYDRLIITAIAKATLAYPALGEHIAVVLIHDGLLDDNLSTVEMQLDQDALRGGEYADYAAIYYTEGEEVYLADHRDFADLSPGAGTIDDEATTEEPGVE